MTSKLIEFIDNDQQILSDIIGIPIPKKKAEKSSAINFGIFHFCTRFPCSSLSTCLQKNRDTIWYSSLDGHSAERYKKLNLKMISFQGETWAGNDAQSAFEMFFLAPVLVQIIIIRFSSAWNKIQSQWRLTNIYGFVKVSKRFKIIRNFHENNKLIVIKPSTEPFIASMKRQFYDNLRIFIHLLQKISQFIGHFPKKG